MAFAETSTIGPPVLFGFDDDASVVLLGPIVAGLQPYILAPPPQSDAGYEVRIELAVPAGAVMSRAVVHVAATAPGNTTIGKIATVRSSAGVPTSSSNSMVIDFGTMRTVSGISAPTAINDVTPWNGTSFDTTVGPMPIGDLSRAFQEMQTERLLVSFDGQVAPQHIADTGGITTTTPPADLELLVAGQRAWFRQGAAPAGFGIDVDITTPVQAAVAAGATPVEVVLRARVPGTLELSMPDPPVFLRTHVVQFAGQDAMVLDVDAEGIVDVALDLPGEAATWKIHRVMATVHADERGPTRVQPAMGPDELDGAQLVLDPDRRIVARIPSQSLSRYRTIVGVRVRLLPGAAGIEVAGGVLGGTDEEPGEPLPAQHFDAVTVEPGATASPVAGWVTLPLSKPLALPAKSRVWLSIAATRGSALLGLAAAPPQSLVADDEHGIAVLRRIAPNGIAKPMSTAGTLRTDALALRLIGTPATGTAIDLVEVALAATDATGAIVPLDAAAEPTDAADRFSIALTTPGAIARPVLQPIVTAATRLTIGPVVIAYEESP